MLGLLDAPTTKPNRVEPGAGGKDEKYHLDYAKYCISNSGSDAYYRFIKKYQINKHFYSGRQWGEKEDIETFLRDTDGNERNRIQIVFNIIRPLVENYRGNSNILRIGASCRSSSPRSITRKEEALQEKLFKRDVADQAPAFEQALMAGDNSVGRDEQETKQIFENKYVDEFALNIDRLMKYVEDLNNFEDLKFRAGEDMALAGISVVEGFEYGNHLRFENVPPDEFFWDTTARLYDLSDAGYMGRGYMALPSEIYEQYQVSEENMKNIEAYVESNSGAYYTNDNSLQDYYKRTGYSDNRVPVYRVFWKDIEKIKYGYVQSEYGDYKVLVRLDERDDEGNLKYKESDLVTPPDTIAKPLKKKFGNKKMAYLTVDTLRYCVLIPSDVISKRVKGSTDNPVRDIALEYGVYEYLEKTERDFRSVKYPFKCNCWGYIDGEVLSPVDDAISPQRFINRVLSVAENQINNSGGASFAYDASAVDPRGGEEQLLKDIASSRPVKLDSRGMGMTNVLVPYDNNPKAGTYALFDIIPTMKGIVDQTTGVNEALRGESMGSDQLVGVTQSLIQRGSLMQEPFYRALQSVFTQMYQMTATVGKNMYIDNEAELHIAVGDDAAERIMLSKDMKLEDFRVFIKRDQDDETQKQTANQMLSIFLQMGLLDDKDFANLYDRSTPAEVTNALRINARAKIELERQQAEADAAASEQAMAQEQQMMQQQQAMMGQQEDKKHLQDIEKIYAKEDAKLGASNPMMGV